MKIVQQIDMKIIEVTPISGMIVATDEPEFNEYVRYGPDCWYVRMGESEEPWYEYGQIEKLYQECVRGNPHWDLSP